MNELVLCFAVLTIILAPIFRRLVCYVTKLAFWVALLTLITAFLLQ